MDSIMTETLLEPRARLLGPNMSTFYDEPVHLVRGLGTRVWDADGREYLDCYNNVPHVGHCHRKVVEAICNKRELSTRTRAISMMGYSTMSRRLLQPLGQALTLL